jgi:hypothetical protein
MFPHFIGIGAQRAGTTWLYWNLKVHPDIWLPSIKEVHYFDRDPKYKATSRLVESNPWTRMFGPGIHNKEWRQFLTKCMTTGMAQRLSFVKNKKKLVKFTEDLSWLKLYFFGRYGDEWYQDLFRRQGQKVTGDITPSYSILDHEDIAHVARLLPNAKIIFLIRNPVERAWSQLIYEYGAAAIEKKTLDQIKLLLKASDSLLRGNYARTLRHWKEHFPQKQIFLGYFEDIKHNPEHLLRRIIEFIGVPFARFPESPYLHQAVLQSKSTAMRHKVRLFLGEIYIPQMEELNAMLGGNPNVSRWLDKEKSILTQNSKSQPAD